MRHLAFIFAALLLAGCAGSRIARGGPLEGEVRRLEAVPFFPDGTKQCGPSTLASVLTFWGHPTPPEVLRREIFLPKLEGTLPMDMLPAVEARGLTGRVYDGDLDDLKAQINAGRPLIVNLDMGVWKLRSGHFAVVTGYDDQRQGVYLHSGEDENLLMPYDRFLAKWDRTDRWTLLVLPAAEKEAIVP